MLRLASLLWRLRRATTMEPGLFEIQAEQLKAFKRVRHAVPASRVDEWRELSISEDHDC